MVIRSITLELCLFISGNILSNKVHADIYSDACEHAFVAKSAREEMFEFCKRAANAGDSRSEY